MARYRPRYRDDDRAIDVGSQSRLFVNVCVRVPINLSRLVFR